MTTKQPLPSAQSLPCWQPVGDNWWRCRECASQVNRGTYPTFRAHADTCSYSAAPLIQQASQAQAQCDRLHGEIKALRTALEEIAGVHGREAASPRMLAQATLDKLYAPEPENPLCAAGDAPLAEEEGKEFEYVGTVLGYDEGRQAVLLEWARQSRHEPTEGLRLFLQLCAQLPNAAIGSPEWTDEHTAGPGRDQTT